MTVGSTLFPHLTNAILSVESLDLLVDHIGRLKVQIGKGTVPDDLSERVKASWSEEAGLQGVYKGMEVEVFRYTDDFDGLVGTADLVISHAGTSTSQNLPYSFQV